MVFNSNGLASHGMEVKQEYNYINDETRKKISSIPSS